MTNPAAIFTPEISDIIVASPLEWGRFCVLIENKQKEMVAFDPNVLQERMSEVYETMQELGLPTRMLDLKPRQSGSSTFATMIVDHHCKRYSARGVVMADDFGNSQNLYRMATRHCDTDVFPWGVSHKTANKEIHFTNGSFIEQDTAQNPRAGIAATRQVVHLSEVAKYPQDGVRDAYITISNMMASVNKKGPNSLVIAETTAEGASGWFYDQWQGAVTLEEFLAGKHGNGWIKVFAAWFEFEDHSLEVSPGQIADIMSTLDKREKRGVEKYNWTPQQIAWRRMVLKTECGGDEGQFDSHYPEDPESCFQSSGRPRFDMDGMQALQSIAKVHMAPQFGTFSHNQSVAWTPRAENEASVFMYEEPREGCRYIVVVDCATGATYTRGADPDCHAAIVLRAGYKDEHGRSFPPRIVCRLVPNCRLDIDILANLVERMSLFYGRCLIVPERNMGIALIEQLRLRDLPLYQEETIDMLTSKTSHLLGWETNKESKRRCVERLAALIRDSTGPDPKILLDEHTLEQCRTFVVDAKGGCAAQSGKHDDDVMVAAIGVTCIESATTLSPMVRRRRPPADRASWKPVRG